MQHILQIVNKLSAFQIVGHSGEVARAATEIPLLKPEVILADIRLKDGDSFQLF